MQQVVLFSKVQITWRIFLRGFSNYRIQFIPLIKKLRHQSMQIVFSKRTQCGRKSIRVRLGI